MTHTYKFIEYDPGDRELYELKSDPYEENNIYESAETSLLENLKT